MTVPSARAGNDGQDNVEFNLIARVNDVLEAPATNYSVLDLLGQGTFGQVFRCQDHATKDIVAIKVVKNKPAYRNQALLEIEVAKQVRSRVAPPPLPCAILYGRYIKTYTARSINSMALYSVIPGVRIRKYDLSALIRKYGSTNYDSRSASEVTALITRPQRVSQLDLVRMLARSSSGVLGQQ